MSQPEPTEIAVFFVRSKELYTSAKENAKLVFKRRRAESGMFLEQRIFVEENLFFFREAGADKFVYIKRFFFPEKSHF